MKSYFAGIGFQGEYWTKNLRLWELTVQTIPTFVNLRHLLLSPTISISYFPNTFLPACKFQLETLTWGLEDRSLDTLLLFLRAQPGLLRLEKGQCPDEEDLTWIPDDVCPNLQAVTCSFSSFIHMSRTRQIIALKADIDMDYAVLVQHDEHLVQKLEYLSLWGYIHFRNSFGIFDVNISILELETWSVEVR